jgi:hypothetical protein
MTRLESWLLHVLASMVASSGAAYFWMKHLVASDDPFAVVHHPLEGPALKLHILASPLLVLALGSVLRSHVLGKLELGARSNRLSGIAALVAVIPMIASGYLLQTLSSPGGLRAALVVHLGTSAIFALAYVAHAIVGLALARQRSGAA